MLALFSLASWIKIVVLGYVVYTLWYTSATLASYLASEASNVLLAAAKVGLQGILFNYLGCSPWSWPSFTRSNRAEVSLPFSKSVPMFESPSVTGQLVTSQGEREVSPTEDMISFIGTTGAASLFTYLVPKYSFDTDHSDSLSKVQVATCTAFLALFSRAYVTLVRH